MKYFLLFAVVSMAVLRADPAPALTWTSDAYLIAGGFTGASTTPTGMSVASFCPGSCNLNFLVDRTFTVTSPGTFVLSTVISFLADAENCMFLFCQPSATISAGIDGVTDIGVGSQRLTDSGSNTVDNCSLDFPCRVFMTIDDSRTNSIILGLGDYILEENYTVFAEGLNAGLSVESDASLVPIPEPRDGIIIVACALLVRITFKRLRNPLGGEPMNDQLGAG